MPPRSLCLNVFTTSLGNGSLSKEAEGVVREVEEEQGHVVTGERARHDSLQEDPMSNTTLFAQSIIAATVASPATSTTISGTTLPAHMEGSAAVPFFSSTTILPTICSTCTRPPPSGHSLLRCSRCKRTYYCSRTCQKQAWKTHKTYCDPVIAGSGMNTPDVSMPGSPATDNLHDAAYNTLSNH